MNETEQPKYETVMLIDDNNLDLYVASRLMMKNNFAQQVLEYSLATQALRYLQENQQHWALMPQVIFVDIYMPVMSGFEFMEEYEKLNADFKEKCQVYIISSSIDDIDINRANKDKNVVAFREKPVTKEFLKNV